jgi:hypothetical protein
MMSVDAASEMVMLRPRVEVARLASEPERAPMWCANIKSVACRAVRLSNRKDLVTLKRLLEARG